MKFNPEIFKKENENLFLYKKSICRIIHILFVKKLGFVTCCVVEKTIILLIFLQMNFRKNIQLEIPFYFADNV